MIRLTGVVAIALAFLAGAVQLQATRERLFPPSTGDADAMYLRSATAVRRLSGAYTTLAADGYWIRALQYYGGTKQRLQEQAWIPEPPPMLAAPTSDDYSLLYPMLDLATSLDPRFTIAYRFGAVFLAEARPRGAGRPDLAVALLEKGIRAQPDKWEYMEDAGFVHYWYRAQLSGGGRLVSEGQRGPRGPVVVALAGGDHDCTGWRPAVVAGHVGGDSAVGRDRLAAPGRRTPSAAAPGARRHRQPPAGASMPLCAVPGTRRRTG